MWEMWNGEKLHMLEKQLDSTLDTIPILDGQTILLQDKAGLASQPYPRLYWETSINAASSPAYI